MIWGHLECIEMPTTPRNKRVRREPPLLPWHWVSIQWKSDDCKEKGGGATSNRTMPVAKWLTVSSIWWRKMYILILDTWLKTDEGTQLILQDLTSWSQQIQRNKIPASQLFRFFFFLLFTLIFVSLKDKNQVRVVLCLKTAMICLRM